jgi:hypothetical protein
MAAISTTATPNINLADCEAVTVDRIALSKAVQRQIDQDRYCWSLPLAVVAYCIFCSALIMHIQVESSYELEAG